MADTCTTLENLFLDHAMLIRNDVVKSIQDSDFYIKRLPKEPWLDGQGYQYSYPIYERSIVTKAVTDTDFFTAFATLDNTPTSDNNLPSTGACNLPGFDIDSFGITTRTVTLMKAAINSPDICLDDLKFQWQVMDQIKNVTRVLAENSKWVWSNTYQDAYRNNCGNFMAGYDGIQTSFNPAEPPRATLSFGLLEEIHQQLGFNGGSINPSGRMDDGTPVYEAVGSLYTFNDIKKKSANERNDFRYMSAGGGADQGILTERIGLGSKVYQGYKFNAVQFAPRWDVVGGAYQRQYPYTASNATRGQKWEVGDNYKNALYEDTAVYHDDVLRVLIPKPGVAAGGGLSYLYGPYSWAGEFVWRNIPDRDCNIDGNIGFFRALFAFGIKVERPDLGFVVRHLRCDRDEDLTDCYGNSVTPIGT